MATRAPLSTALLLTPFFFFFAGTLSEDIDITTLGAKADGSSDISQVLLAAWKKACTAGTASKIIIPAGKYLLHQITLEGPCKAPIEVALEGTLLAPVDHTLFKGSDSGWVSFLHVEGFTLSGTGTFDGQGTSSWSKNECTKSKSCSALPINIRFDYLTKAVVRDITSLNSKMFHINILGCKDITLTNVKVTAPENSANTDGIHIGRSEGVTITGAVIKTGDDCVSLGDGSKQVTITGITCGPGHGISVGSLGKYPNEEAVTGLRVTKCTITGTTNGVRIKTWPGSPAGTASDMHFEDITMNGVANPIFIDQKYCPWNMCKQNVESNVKLRNVSFKNIRGTSTTRVAVSLLCSASNPCEGVELSNIDLKYTGTEGPAVSACSNVKPTLTGTLFPQACTTAALPLGSSTA